MPTAYSYVRFSRPEQIKGDSIRRQEELSQKYAETHGLTLDDTLRFTDLGVSAFKGDNATTGQLGIFISAIDSGRIQPGSYLLVESLDRLSRAEIISALNLFTQILSKGITIVTLTDKREYTKDSINDIGNLMYSLLVMSRAHEESLMKSKRGKAAWDNKRKRAREGKHKLTKVCPNWLELQEDEFRPIPDRVAIVQKIFHLALNGHGYVSIAKKLNLDGNSTYEFCGRKANGWYPSYIVRILKSPAVYGQFTPHEMVDGKRTPKDPIEDYYPAIISKDDFFAVQAAIASRRGKGGEVGPTVNLFANLMKCGKCGGSAVRINKSGKQASVDKYYKWVAVVCDAGRRGVTDCGWNPWKLDDLESAVLAELRELDIGKILDDKAQDQDLLVIKQSIDSLAEQIAAIQRQKERLVDAIAGGDEGLAVITDRIKALTKQKADLTATRDILTEEYETESHRLATMTRSRDEIKRLAGRLENNDVRLIVQTEIRKLVDRIVLHMTIQKFVIYYHQPKLVVRFRSGKSITFTDTGGEMVDDPV